MLFLDGLIKGTLIKRYKRFLADIELENSEIVTAHCPNSGSLLKANIPGSVVWISRVPEGSSRKLMFTWELIELDGTLVCVNTQFPNKIFEEALLSSKIPQFSSFRSYRREVKFGQSSRIDFLIEMSDGRPCYVEVKSVHMREDSSGGLRVGLFPDSVTERGAKQVREMMSMVRAGAQAYVFYVIQRNDIDAFSVAKHIDPVYAQVINDAHSVGINSLAYTCVVNSSGVVIDKEVVVL